EIGAPPVFLAARPLGAPEEAVLAREQGGLQHGSSEERSRNRRDTRQPERPRAAEPVATRSAPVYAREPAAAHVHHRSARRAAAPRAPPPPRIATGYGVASSACSS